MHFSVCMDIGVTHRLTTLHEENFHFCLFPPKHGEMDGADGREEVFAGGAIIHTYQAHNPRE